MSNHPDSKVHGANMGPIWGRQDPGGPHVGPMNFVIWAGLEFLRPKPGVFRPKWDKLGLTRFTSFSRLTLGKTVKETW